MRMREDVKTLTGPDKAALLLMAVGEENASRLFSMMEDEEIRELSQHMATLGSASSDLIEHLLVEFADQISATGAVVGNYDSTERLLLKVMDPDKVTNIMEEIRGPAGRTMWDKLGNVNETGAGQLSQERISANRRRGAVQDQAGTCGARPRRPARAFRHGGRHAHAAHGGHAKGRPRPTSSGPCATSSCRTWQRPPAGTLYELMADIFNFLDRTLENPFPGSARGAQPRRRRSDQGLDVHLRGPGQARPGRRPNSAQRGGERQGGRGAQGRIGGIARFLLLQHVRTRPPR